MKIEKYNRKVMLARGYGDSVYSPDLANQYNLHPFIALTESEFDAMQRVVDAAKAWREHDKGFTRIALFQALDALDNPKVDPIAGSYEFAERLQRKDPTP